MRTREFLLLFLVADIILINLSYFIVALGVGVNFSLWPVDHILLVCNLSWIVTFFIFIDDVQYLKKDAGNLIRSLWYRFVTYAAIAACVAIGYAIPLTKITFVEPLAVFVVFKIFITLFFLHRMSLSNNRGSKVLIVGDSRMGNQIYRYCMENDYLGYKPLGILLYTESDVNKNIIGTVADFQKIYDATPFEAVIISVPLDNAHLIKELIFIAEKNGVRPRIVPNWYSVIDRNFIVSELGSIPLLDIRNVPLYHYPNRFWKRAFDLVVATILVILLIPVFIIVAIAVKLDSRGTVFYKPIRLGVNGRPFTVYKFRSMFVSDDPNQGSRSTTVNDERISKVGNFIRKTNLDELPQLFNVIMNEMSLVGPRPHRLLLNKNLQQKMNTYMVRHFVKPGITGWAQVHGWRGPTENRLQYMGRTLHDLWYIENWNFWLDLYIMFLTVFGKKSRKNAF